MVVAFKMKQDVLLDVVCRDALLASLLDGVRASGNRDVHVKMVPTPRGRRIGPLSVPVEEEVEMPQIAPHTLHITILSMSSLFSISWLHWNMISYIFCSLIITMVMKLF